MSSAVAQGSTDISFSATQGAGAVYSVGFTRWQVEYWKQLLRSSWLEQRSGKKHL